MYCTSVCCFSAPEYSGVVKGLYVNKYKTVLVRLESLTPTCGDSSWPFEFQSDSEVAQEWMSLLLYSKASNKPIVVGYNPNATGR